MRVPASLQLLTVELSPLDILDRLVALNAELGTPEVTTTAGAGDQVCHAGTLISESAVVTIEDIERTELNGQKLQGTLTAVEVNSFLKNQGMEHEGSL
jgi:hypothetical protein